nr:integrase, catalytic region, zinc finger, CCHC-type, peptidase aspartic, catalytic [Tanacetum cinerariifolium]
MANLLKDIQYAGFDTRPPMLDRTDFASWKQRIRLHCRGKENGVNILKSTNEGPFWMGKLKETLTEGTEGALYLGTERPRVYFDLTSEEKDRYNADIRATNILLQGLPKDIYSLINHYTNAKDIWENVKMLLEGLKLTKEDRKSQLFVTTVKLNRGLRDSNYDQLYAYLKQHEALTAQTMFLANLSFADLVSDEVGPSYDVDILSEGIQKALTTEIKEMKAIFDELEAEVNQNVVNKKSNEIEQKNLLIANDTLIANCLSKEVFYIATNSELNVPRFSEMHDAQTVVQAHRLELETELSKLKGCSKHMTGDNSRLKNFMKNFTGTVRFRNDHFGAIIGYGDYVICNSVISKHSCYVGDTDGVELIKGSRGSNLYTISVEDMIKSSPICLFSKASKIKSWLWHHRLNHLNFGTINDLERKDLV